MAYRCQQCHCLAALPAKMSVFNSHMQGSHSIISNKPQIAHQKLVSTIKTQKARVTNKTYEQGRRGSMAPGARSKFGAPCSNLRSFGSKCTLLKKVLVTLLGLFGVPRIGLSDGRYFTGLAGILLLI